MKKLGSRETVTKVSVMQHLELHGVPEDRTHGAENGVRTARYTIWNFLPKNLLEQLSQLSNLYFFAVGLLQMIPTISVTGGLPAMWFPLSQVMLVVALLEGYADWKRSQSDKQENCQESHRFAHTYHVGSIILQESTGPSVTPCRWEDLRVGDIVVCSNREPFPADLLLLASSREDGRAMIETASLDGETNLKFRCVPTALFDNGLSSFEASQNLVGSIEYDAPSARLDSFRGTCSVKLLDSDMDPLKFAVGVDNILLRACKLRNTEWIIGLVIYAGHDTKIYQNAASSVAKQSRMESKANLLLFVSFVTLMLICFIYSIGSVILDVMGMPDGAPFILPSNMVKRALTRFVSWNLLIVNLIPISLFFFLNISRAIQAKVMQWDPSMMDPTTSQGVAVRNDRLNSDLGCVEYVFADKTGTLTRNYMELRRLCIAGRSYGGAWTGSVVTPHVNIDDEELRHRIRQEDPDVFSMFIHLAANHAVFLESESSSEIEIKEADPSSPSIDSCNNEIVYSASSSDEGALVYGALHFGFALTAQAGNSLTVRLPGGEAIKIQVLARFEFDSDRKRSSVLSRYRPPNASQDKIVLLTKGADNVIRSLLRPELLGCREVQTTFNEVSAYAQSGLRTLCIAQREITEDMLAAWLPKYDEANASLNDTEVAVLISELERDLELQGAVGVEDKLADEVAPTIQKLKAAGIKVAMLTGDKMETAINIGLQTGILPDKADIVKVDDPSTAPDALRGLLLRSGISTQSLSPPLCLVIDSASLDGVLTTDPDLIGPAVDACSGAIVCRVTPQQKADVVKLVRQYHKDNIVALCIGDGGNDCNMIQSANVGVGIRGVEGLQAFNVSDYGVSRFKDLVPLILVHGRWNHRRLSKLILYTLSKMLVINLPQVVAGFFSLLTPQRIFAESINQCVNPFFSSVTPVVFAVVDFEIPGETAVEYPASYLYRHKKSVFGLRVYLMYLLNAVWHGCVSVLVPFWLLGIDFSDGAGKTADIWVVGTIAFYCALFLMTQKLNFECYSALPAVFVVNIASISIFFVAIFALHGVRETAHQLGSSLMFYVIWSLTFFLGIFRDYFWKVYQRHHRPSPIHRLQQEVKHPVPFKGRPSRILKEVLDEFCFFNQPDPSVTRKLRLALQRKSN